MSTQSAQSQQLFSFAREQLLELRRLIDSLAQRDQSADCRALVGELRFTAEALAQSIEDIIRETCFAERSPPA